MGVGRVAPAHHGFGDHCSEGHAHHDQPGGECNAGIPRQPQRNRQRPAGHSEREEQSSEVGGLFRVFRAHEGLGLFLCGRFAPGPAVDLVQGSRVADPLRLAQSGHLAALIERLARLRPRRYHFVSGRGPAVARPTRHR